MLAGREMAEKGAESEVYFCPMQIYIFKIMWLLMLRENNGVRCGFSTDSKMID